MSSRLLCPAAALLLSGLGLLTFAPGLARAQARPFGRQAAFRQALATVVGELRQARKLLAQANRDYNGHRALAARQVTKALHALRPPRPGQTTPAGQAKPGGAAAAPAPEAQAVSDGQMKQAGQLLNTALTQLASLPATPRTTAAAPHVRQAIQEIQQGLEFIRQQEQKAGAPR
jgi:hypothetical protein